MADPRPTRGQWKAIQELDKHLTVSAGAGAGKTWVLTERYATMLAGRPMVPPPLELEAEAALQPPHEPSRPGQIVAITFTKEAAGEMKERIRGRLRKWKSEAPPDEQRRIALLKEEVERATITTIHGYCSELLRQYPIEAGVDPQFRVLEESEAVFWLDEAVRELLDEGLAQEADWAVRLITEYGYETLVRHVCDFYPGVREQTEDFADVADLTLSMLDKLSGQLEAKVDELERLIRNVVHLDLAGMDASKGSVQRALRLERDWPAIQAVIQAWRASGYEYSPEVLAVLQDLEAGWGVLVKGLKEDVPPLKTHVGTLYGLLVPSGMKQAVRDLCHLLERVHHSYTERKARERSLDFTDLQNRAVELLQNEAVREWQGERLRFLMVDEFQDTNPVQKKLLDALSADNEQLRLFVVGDAKQSIYRFRGADLEVFLRTQEEVKERDGEHVSLAHNFRTQEPIISFVNRLFDLLMPVQDGGPRYATEYQAMEATRQPAHGNPMVELVHLLPKDDATQSKLQEAEWVAKRIREMVGGEMLVPTADGLRQVAYRDVTILFSAMTSVYIYEHALQAQGIPYYIIGSRQFYRRQEVTDLVLLLQAIVEERDPIALIGALRSPLFGVSDEALYWLGREGLLAREWAETRHWDKMRLDDREKLSRAEELLRRWRQEKAYKPAGDLLAGILQATGYERALLLTFGGTQKVGNVRKLLELAYEQSVDRSGVLAFLQHLLMMIEGEVQEEDAQVESDRSDVVKIMTIHKSKGLEFPVVFLPDLGRQFNLQSGGAFRYDPEYGLVLSFGEHDEWNDFGYARELRELNKAKAIEEERRKLYVAVTRARDYLVMVGTREDSASAKKKAMTRHDIRWFDWLVATIGGGDLSQMEGSILAEWPEVKWVTVQEEEAESVQERPPIVQLPSLDQVAAAKEGKVLSIHEQMLKRVAASHQGGATSVQEQEHALDEIASALAESTAEWGSGVASSSLRRGAFPLLGPIQPREGEHPGILLSVSALLTYLTCPRQYFYKYEWKLPEQSLTARLERADDELADERDSADDQFDLFAEPDPRASLDPTVRGTLVHRVLELLESPDEADSLIDRALAEQSIVGEVASYFHPCLKKDVNTYLQSPLFQNVSRAADKKSEMMFRLALGPHEITGIIDKVIRGETGRATVIDYKTNRVFSTARIRQAVEHYSPQLQLYTLVTDRLLGWPVEQAVLYFTVPGRTEKVPIAASDLSALEQRAHEACDHIATHDRPEDFAQLEQEADCERCGYRLLCRGY